MVKREALKRERFRAVKTLIRKVDNVPYLEEVIDFTEDRIQESNDKNN